MMVEKKDDQSQRQLFLHAGYHKTGTTFLQKQVFPKVVGINYLGRSWKDDSFNKFFKDFAFTNDVEFDADKEKHRFHEILTGYFAKSKVDASFPSLISHESLMTGSEWFGSETAARAVRLKETFPNAKVIIGIRNQSDFIDSNYRQYVILGGKLGFSSFLKTSMAAQYGLLPRLKYDQVVRLYFDLFGRENVHVYLLEDLKHQPEEALLKLMNFLGVKNGIEPLLTNTNKGISRFSINMIRILNRLLLEDFNEQYYRWVNQNVSTIESLRWRFVRVIKRLEANGKSGKFVRKSDDKWIKGHFKESNHQLAQLLGVDLSGLGY